MSKAAIMNRRQNYTNRVVKSGEGITPDPKDFYNAGMVKVLGIVTTPVISVVGSTVTITTVTENSIIYYTLDGTDPDQWSNVYIEPFETDDNVRARGFKLGYTPSNIASELNTMSDYFEILGDPSWLWTVTQSTGVPWTDTLVTTVTGNVGVDTYVRYRSTNIGVASSYLTSVGHIVGDFDIQVDFNNANNLFGLIDAYWRFIFSVESVLNTTYTSIFHEWYGSFGDAVLQYQAYDSAGGAEAFLATSNTSGKLRLVRVGTDVSKYWWNGVGWILLKTTSFNSDNVWVYLSTYKNSDESGVIDMRADNFIVNSADSIIIP